MRVVDDFSDLWSKSINQSCSVFNKVADVRASMFRCNDMLSHLQKIRQSLARDMSYEDMTDEELINQLNVVVREAKKGMENLKNAISNEFFEMGCLFYGGTRLTEEVFTNADLLCNMVSNIATMAYANTNLLGDSAITQDTYKQELRLLEAIVNACGQLEDSGGYGYTGNPQRFKTKSGDIQPSEYNKDDIALVSSQISSLASELMDISASKLNNAEINELPISEKQKTALMKRVPRKKTDEEVFEQAEKNMSDFVMTDDELELMDGNY